MHLNDNSKYVKKGQPGHDPLFKVGSFLDLLIKNFQQAYHLSRKLSIDESMIGLKGRLSFIQYLPKKPTKWGMKAFVLADSRNGYTYNWRLYTGKHKTVWQVQIQYNNRVCINTSYYMSIIVYEIWFSKGAWVLYPECGMVF